MKKKKSDLKVMIFFIIIGIALFGYTGYVVKDEFFKKEEPVIEKKLRSLELYGYSIRERDNEVFKNNFHELEKVLNENPIDYSKYAEYVSKLFRIDLFTLDNKLTSTDIYKMKIERVDSKIFDNYNELDKESAYIYYLMNNGYSYNEKIIKENVSYEEYAYFVENIDSNPGFELKAVE